MQFVGELMSKLRAAIVDAVVVAVVVAILIALNQAPELGHGRCARRREIEDHYERGNEIAPAQSAQNGDQPHRPKVEDPWRVRAVGREDKKGHATP